MGGKGKGNAGKGKGQGPTAEITDYGLVYEQVKQRRSKVYQYRIYIGKGTRNFALSL